MMGRRVMSTIAGAALCMSIAAPAMAVIRYVDGGKWNYGTNAQSVWSYYDHPRGHHKSSAVGVNYYTSKCVVGGVTSIAHGPKRGSGNQSYYAFC